MFHGVYLIYKNEGFYSLYKGSFARCAYHVPYTAITMSLHEKIRSNLLKRFWTLNILNLLTNLI